METNKTAFLWKADLLGGVGGHAGCAPFCAGLWRHHLFRPRSGFAAQGAIAGIIGATALGLIASTFGGTDRLITSPCAPAAAVLTAVSIDFVQHGVSPESSILLLMLIAVLAGIIQIGLGLAGIGSLIKFIPYPVVSGYLSGVGLTIMGSQLPRVLGAPKNMGFWDALHNPGAWRWESVVVGVLVVATMLLVSRIIRAVPAAIIAMLVGVAGYLPLGFCGSVSGNSHDNPLVVGPLGTGNSHLLDAALHNLKALRAWDVTSLTHVFVPALTLATLLSIDTLKTCV